MTTSITESTRRRSELDAIRALVVVGLVFFHAALVFDSRDDFYVKNPETTDVILSSPASAWCGRCRCCS